MQRETRLFILGTLVAVSIFCGLYLLLAEQPAAAPALAGKAISLVEAPLVAKVLVGLAVLIGVIESVMARLRLNRVPLLLAGATVLAGLGVLLVLAKR